MNMDNAFGMIRRCVAPVSSAAARLMRIADFEARSEYGETRGGILWLPITVPAFSALVAVVFHKTTAMPPVDFFLYVLAGCGLWSLIAGPISGGGLGAYK